MLDTTSRLLRHPAEILNAGRSTAPRSCAARTAAIRARLAEVVPSGTGAARVMGLDQVGPHAAILLAQQGWTRTTPIAPDGAMCAHGALELAAAQRSRLGDYPALSMVFHARGLTPRWNDHPVRTAQEVRAALERDPVTDAELAAVLGPRWPLLVTFLRIVHELLPDTVPTDRAGLRSVNGSVGGAVAEGERHPLRRLAALARADGFLHYAASPDARFGRQALALLAVTGTPVAGPLIPEAVVVQLQHLAQLSTMARSTVGSLLAGPLRSADTSTERAALLAGLSWTVLALDLREELLASPSGPRLYATLTGPWRRAVGPLHPDDPDAAEGADDIDAVLAAPDPRVLGEVLAPTVALRYGSPDALQCVSTSADGSSDGYRNGSTEFVIAGYRAEHTLGGMTYCVVPATEPALRWPALASTGPALIEVRPVESPFSG